MKRDMRHRKFIADTPYVGANVAVRKYLATVFLCQSTTPNKPIIFSVIFFFQR